MATLVFDLAKMEETTMDEIPVSHFLDQPGGALRRVRKHGRAVVIVSRGKPVAVLSPMTPPTQSAGDQAKRRRQLRALLDRWAKERVDEEEARGWDEVLASLPGDRLGLREPDL